MTYVYRFSLVIPTRNRTDTLRHTLQTCLDQRGFDDYEIVVNDNSGDYATSRMMAKLLASDPRAQDKIKYHQRSEPCSMARSFEDGINRAQGEYLIVLGDDDGLVPFALKELDALIRQTGGAVVKWRPAIYGWPSVALSADRNYLGFGLSRAFQIVNGREALAKALETLNPEVMPSLYVNSAVRRAVIEGLRDGEGRLMRSRAPMFYSAVLLSFFCGDFIETTIPFTVAGFSGASCRVSMAMGGDNPLPRTDARALCAQDGIALHPLVPDLPVYPEVDLADSFIWARAYYFSSDEEFVLSRQQLMEVCTARSNVNSPVVRETLLRACHDTNLAEAVTEMMNRYKDVQPPRRSLRPAMPKSDWLELDVAEFGGQTIADAALLVHKMIWPGDASLRYDLQ